MTDLRAMVRLYRWTAVVCCAFLVTALTSVTPVAAQIATCNGVAATIVGTEDDDVLVGTDGDDVIVAFGGNDLILAGAGDDLVCGGAGRDKINGQAGNDSLFGGTQRDRLNGGPGNDSLTGNNANDTLRGGNGDDAIWGNTGNDNAIGGRGVDTIRAGQGRDRLTGSGGADHVDGGPGIDDCTDPTTATETNCTKPGDGKTIRVGRGESRYIYGSHNLVIARLLTELGYVVVPAEVVTPPETAFESGDIDLVTAGTPWTPLPDNAELIGTPVWPLQHLQGFQVTKAWAASANIMTLDQINDDPGLYAAIDFDGDGKGELHACGNEVPLGPDGQPTRFDDLAVCQRQVDDALEVAGFDNLERLDLPVMTIRNDLVQRLDDQSPAVTFAPTILRGTQVVENNPALGGDNVWRQLWFFRPGVPGRDVMWLSVTPESSAAITPNAVSPSPPPDLCVSPQGVPCEIGFFNIEIMAWADPAWLELNPAVRLLIEEFEWSDAHEFEMWRNAIPQGGHFFRADHSPENLAAADRWLAEHRRQVDRWLDVVSKSL